MLFDRHKYIRPLPRTAPAQPQNESAGNSSWNPFRLGFSFRKVLLPSFWKHKKTAGMDSEESLPFMAEQQKRSLFSTLFCAKNKEEKCRIKAAQKKKCPKAASSPLFLEKRRSVLENLFQKWKSRETPVSNLHLSGLVIQRFLTRGLVNKTPKKTFMIRTYSC